MDDIEVVIYQHGIPVMRVSTNEIKLESNVDDAYIIDRGEDGKLQRIQTRPDLSPLMIKFEGRAEDMELFEKLTKPREGL